MLRLFLLLVLGHFIAAWAILFKFHLFRMLALVPCTDVIFLTAYCALESDVVSSHEITS